MQVVTLDTTSVAAIDQPERPETEAIRELSLLELEHVGGAGVGGGGTGTGAA